MTYVGKKDREKLGTKPLSVRTVLGQERLHVIPLFQRPYVWKREAQWEPLWRDVVQIASSIMEKRARTHFLGALVLKQEYSNTGAIEVREVIDGQQRLLTLLLLIKAFYDDLGARGLKQEAEPLKKLLFNEGDHVIEEGDQFKLLPNNIDRKPFLSVMRAKGPGDFGTLPTDLNGLEGIVGGYQYLAARVKGWLDEDSKESPRRAMAMRTALCDRFRLVVIDLETEDDPQTIFESLNARGTPLLQSDLAKNLLFQRAKSEGADMESLYEECWGDLDRAPAYWREEVGRGHAKRPRIELFLQHFTSTKLEDEILAESLYRRFRQWTEACPLDSTEEQMRLFIEWARLFRTLDQNTGEDEEGQFFERIRVIDITTVFPLLLFAYDAGKEDPKELAQIRMDLESFLVRRMICSLSTRGYGRFFLRALSKAAKTKGPVAEAVRATLLGGDEGSMGWPDDAAFRKAWMEAPLGSFLRSDRLEMVLKAVERRHRSAKREPIDLTKKLTIEHILPSQWEKKWPLPAELISDESARLRRDTLVQTLGNLTVVTGKLNSAMGNGSWEAKKEALAEHTGLSLNAEILKAPKWDEEEIVKRGEGLFSLALSIWPRPLTGAVQGTANGSAVEIGGVDEEDDVEEGEDWETANGPGREVCIGGSSRNA